MGATTSHRPPTVRLPEFRDTDRHTGTDQVSFYIDWRSRCGRYRIRQRHKYGVTVFFCAYADGRGGWDNFGRCKGHKSFRAAVEAAHQFEFALAERSAPEGGRQ